MMLGRRGGIDIMNTYFGRDSKECRVDPSLGHEADLSDLCVNGILHIIQKGYIILTSFCRSIKSLRSFQIQSVGLGDNRRREITFKLFSTSQKFGDSNISDGPTKENPDSN
jgi:hypothetical protein